MERIKTLKDMNFEGKRALVRVDFNVPSEIEENGEIKIVDDERIRAALPTIDCLISQNCSEITLTTHFGRPGGEVVPRWSVKPIAERLAELLGLKMEVNENVPYVGNKFFFKLPSDYSLQLQKEFPKISMPENLRFWPGEEADPESKEFKEFAKNLVNLGGIRKDIFVQDAFPCCHKEHASIVIPAINLGDSDSPEYIPACAGFLVEKEVTVLIKLFTNPQKPFVVILGGAKVSDKIGVLENLLDKADLFLIGGEMAYTFMKAKGILVGDSKAEEAQIELARGFLERAREKILLPQDHIVAEKIGKELVGALKIKEADIPKGYTGVDIGGYTRRLFIKELKGAKTIFWNGDLGISGIPRYSKGTKTTAYFLKIATERGATTIVGGGNTIAAIKRTKSVEIDDMTFASTGGGASLKFLAGETLPGIAALEQ